MTASVEYGIHCLLLLACHDDTPLSSRELAELQGISPSFLAKIFPKLEKAGILSASEGIHGGYSLAKDADEITFLAIVDAIEGKKPLFDCKEIRGRCAVFEGNPPHWATRGTCSIHRVMLQAEKAMRDVLATQTLGSLKAQFVSKAPTMFVGEISDWAAKRRTDRSTNVGRPKSRQP